MKRCLAITMLLLVLPWVALAADSDEDLSKILTFGKDSERQKDVPQGKVTKHAWNESKVFPGTVRDYWVYVPRQYDGSKPASVMVFQDGNSYVNETGAFRVPIVFDNLIHKKEMPVT